VDIAIVGRILSSPRLDIAKVAWGRDPVGQIHVELSPDGERILVSGNLGTGSAAELARVLDSATSARLVELNSDGGRLYEATAAARQIRARGLDTYVEEHCYSGCTYLFLAGRHRSVAPKASLAFHRPFLEEIQGSASNADSQLNTFRALGVADEFIARIRALSNDEVWYPTPSELVQYNLITSPGATP
jgi:hypothetical protein